MALFNRRNKNVDSVPQEVQDYYQAEKRDRTGIAWLLALGTLVATVLLAVALFFGGRWIYRAVFKDDQNPQTSQQQQEKKEQEGESREEGAENRDQPESTTAPSTPEPGQSTSNNGSNSGTSETTTPPTTTPRTGPEDNL